jgi:hypothetical protein
MTEPTLNELSHLQTGERVARLEQKASDADKALDLARDSVSVAQMVSVGTLILSIVAIILVFIRK